MIVMMSYDIAHGIPQTGRRRLLLSLLAVVALHGLLLLVPSDRKAFHAPKAHSPLSIRLSTDRLDTTETLSTQAATAVEAERTAEPAAPEKVAHEPTALVSLAPTIRPKENRPEITTPDHQAAKALLTRILSSPYLDEDPPQLQPFPGQDSPAAGVTELRVAQWSAPDPLIYSQPARLPFADAPQLAIEYYEDGLMGGMQRFRDSITFSKTWTTRNGTRIGCALILIIPACAWD